MAQAHFSYIVRKWNGDGVPFQTNWYVPEVDPTTGKEFHEREDHAHLLRVYLIIELNCVATNKVIVCYSMQRIAITTREGRNSRIYLERFVERQDNQLHTTSGDRRSKAVSFRCRKAVQ